jgi:SAM-dependent methyltransferase
MMDNKKERLQIVAEGYNKIAWSYDDGYKDVFSRAEEHVVGNLLGALVDSGNGGGVLDMGCGTGLLLDLLRGVEGIGSRYHGYDISQAMLDVAKAKRPHFDDMRRYQCLAHEDVDPSEYNDMEYHFSLFGSPSYSDLDTFLALVSKLRLASDYEATGFFMFNGDMPRCPVEGVGVTPLSLLRQRAKSIVGDDVVVFPLVTNRISTMRRHSFAWMVDKLYDDIRTTNPNPRYNYYSILAYGPQVSRHIGIR